MRAVLLVLVAQVATAQVPLWQPTTKAGTPSSRMEPGTLRTMNVTVLAQQLRESATLYVPLFGRLVKLSRDRQEEIPRGIAWVGHVSEDLQSSAIFATVGGSVAGTIIQDGKMYQVRSIGNDVHVLQEIDNAQFPRELPPGAAPPPRKEYDVKPTCTSDAGDTIDVLVVYTTAARKAAGGKTAANTDAIESTIGLAAAETNQSYMNSNVSQRVRIVHTEEVPYIESGDLKRDRDRLRDPHDGYMDGVAPLRDKYGADAVVLLTETGDGCGISYIMENVSNQFEPYAYAVVLRSCATGNYSFGHELGHIMGARHDWYTDTTDNKPYHNNHGYIQATPTPPSSPWRTVMAYNDACDLKNIQCKRLPFWANPNVKLGVDAMGTAVEPRPADDHDTLNKTAKYVANFRCHQ